jgi:hypothetical protein
LYAHTSCISCLTLHVMLALFLQSSAEIDQIS